MSTSVIPFLSEMVPDSGAPAAESTGIPGCSPGKDAAESVPPFQDIIESLDGRMDATEVPVGDGLGRNPQIPATPGLEDLFPDLEGEVPVGRAPVESPGNPGTESPAVPPPWIGVAAKPSVAEGILPPVEPGEPAGVGGSVNPVGEEPGNLAGSPPWRRIEKSPGSHPTFTGDRSAAVGQGSPSPPSGSLTTGEVNGDFQQVNPGTAADARVSAEIQTDLELVKEVTTQDTALAKNTPRLHLVSDDPAFTEVREVASSTEGDTSFRPSSGETGQDEAPPGTRNGSAEAARVVEGEVNGGPEFKNLEAVSMVEKEISPALEFRTNAGAVEGRGGADVGIHPAEFAGANRIADPTALYALAAQSREIATGTPLAMAELEAWALRESVLEQLETEARWLLKSSSNEAEIHLEPPELGKIRLRLAVTDASVHGFIEVENPLVKAMLQSDLPRLSALLADSGLDLSQFDVLLSEEKQARQQQNSGDQFQGRDGWQSEQESPEAPEPVVARAIGGGHLLDYWM
ncbi:MAG: flagellar hook-length control protein FliK [Candidatus Eisenbacteria sp.]|nr:flagellar hook-length control protein FliK [Candidatus Eisenbacteria bacterium]